MDFGFPLIFVIFFPLIHGSPHHPIFKRQILFGEQAEQLTEHKSEFHDEDQAEQITGKTEHISDKQTQHKVRRPRITEAKAIFCGERICEKINEFQISEDNFNCKQQYLNIIVTTGLVVDKKLVENHRFLTPNYGLIAEKQVYATEKCPKVKRYKIVIFLF